MEKDIAVLGGSFNPIHMGHVMMGMTAARQFGFYRVTLMPNSVTYYKRHATDTVSDEERLEMLHLTAGEYPVFDVSDMEVRRGGTTYTIDTVLELRKTYDKVYFIIGGDSLTWLGEWVRADELLAETTFLVAVRGEVGRRMAEGLIADLEKRFDKVDIRLLDMPETDISSTDIRRRVRTGGSLVGLVPDSVREYIYAGGLYCRRGEE